MTPHWHFAIRGGIIYDANRNAPHIVIDTNGFVSALRSRRGASFRLLNLIDRGEFFINVSVPLVLEYEDVGRRILRQTDLNYEEFVDLLDHDCRTARRRSIYYLWRPGLCDPSVSTDHATIVRFNQADFVGADRFGVRVQSPRLALAEKLSALLTEDP